MHRLKSNTVRDLYHWFIDGLSDAFHDKEKQGISGEVFFRVFGFGADQRILEAEKLVSESRIVHLKKIQNRLNRGEPLQYILGVTAFLDYSIYVRPGVLIPRHETEELVVLALKGLEETAGRIKNKLRILDVGTGSGCIAIALSAAFPGNEIRACDLDEAILQLAKHNALINNVVVDFFVCDVLSGDNNNVLGGSLDMVISNPPYVRESEKASMGVNVLSHEPFNALFVPDNDPLLFYRAIAARSMQWLRCGGLLYFEINEALGMECAEVIMNSGFHDVCIRQDIHGKDRFISARKPPETV